MLKTSYGSFKKPYEELVRFYFTDGDNLERSYKQSLSDSPEWEQREHASDWVLLEENIGENLCIDETSLQDDLFTILSNKDGHCKQGTLVAAVRSTKAQDVVDILLKIPEEQLIIMILHLHLTSGNSASPFFPSGAKLNS